MSDTVISVEHLSKRYRLGVINTGTFKDDLKVWFAQVRGKPNPLAKVGEADYGNREGDTIWALKDINFTVQRGEALGIIGRNGAGKSTLLKILSRVTNPTEGHVHVKGRIASLLEVGTGFHPELTGRENIYLNGAIMGMSRAEVARKFDEIVDFSGVEKFIDTPVKRYSSGMYVRLAFAVAAYLEPEILIVDEVLAVGDAEFQKKCLGKMGGVAHEGRTVLFVSHNMGAIINLCNSCLVFNFGKITYHGPTDEAISHYFSKINNFQNTLQQRTGNKKGILERIIVQNSNYVYTGSIVKIEFLFELFEAINSFNIGFSLHDEKGRTLSISYTPKISTMTKGKHSIIARINPFYFTPGRYTIRARLSEDYDDIDFPAGDFVEFYVKNALSEANYYRPELMNNGLAILNIEWTKDEQIID